MTQTFIKPWWLLTVSGVLDAIMSVIYFNQAERGIVSKVTIILVGRLTLAAGICTMAAGLWRSATGKCWPLVLNGLALTTLGVVLNGVFGSKISLLTISSLMLVMALSLGICVLLTAAPVRRRGHVAESWFFGAAGVVLFSFAVAFLALGLGWIKLTSGSPGESLIWFGAYFVFSAICMLALALREYSDESHRGEALPPLAHPRHAH